MDLLLNTFINQASVYLGMAFRGGDRSALGPQAQTVADTWRQLVQNRRDLSLPAETAQRLDQLVAGGVATGSMTQLTGVIRECRLVLSRSVMDHAPAELGALYVSVETLPDAPSLNLKGIEDNQQKFMEVRSFEQLQEYLEVYGRASFNLFQRVRDEGPQFLQLMPPVVANRFRILAQRMLRVAEFKRLGDIPVERLNAEPLLGEPDFMALVVFDRMASLGVPNWGRDAALNVFERLGDNLSKVTGDISDPDVRENLALALERSKRLSFVGETDEGDLISKDDLITALRQGKPLPRNILAALDERFRAAPLAPAEPAREAGPSPQAQYLESLTGLSDAKLVAEKEKLERESSRLSNSDTTGRAAKLEQARMAEIEESLQRIEQIQKQRPIEERMRLVMLPPREFATELERRREVVRVAEVAVAAEQETPSALFRLDDGEVTTSHRLDLERVVVSAKRSLEFVEGVERFRNSEGLAAELATAQTRGRQAVREADDLRDRLAQYLDEEALRPSAERMAELALAIQEGRAGEAEARELEALQFQEMEWKTARWTTDRIDDEVTRLTHAKRQAKTVAETKRAELRDLPGWAEADARQEAQELADLAETRLAEVDRELRYMALIQERRHAPEVLAASVDIYRGFLAQVRAELAQVRQEARREAGWQQVEAGKRAELVAANKRLAEMDEQLADLSLQLSRLGAERNGEAARLKEELVAANESLTALLDDMSEALVDNPTRELLVRLARFTNVRIKAALREAAAQPVADRVPRRDDPYVRGLEKERAKADQLKRLWDWLRPHALEVLAHVQPTDEDGGVQLDRLRETLALSKRLEAEIEHAIDAIYAANINLTEAFDVLTDGTKLPAQPKPAVVAYANDARLALHPRVTKTDARRDPDDHILLNGYVVLGLHPAKEHTLKQIRHRGATVEESVAIVGTPWVRVTEGDELILLEAEGQLPVARFVVRLNLEEGTVRILPEAQDQAEREAAQRAADDEVTRAAEAARVAQEARLAREAAAAVPDFGPFGEPRLEGSVVRMKLAGRGGVVQEERPYAPDLVARLANGDLDAAIGRLGVDEGTARHLRSVVTRAQELLAGGHQ